MATLLDKLTGGTAPYTDQRTNLASLLSNIGGQFNAQGTGVLGAGQGILGAGQGILGAGQAGLTDAARQAAATGSDITGFGVSGTENLTNTLQGIGGAAVGAGLGTAGAGVGAASAAGNTLTGAGAGAIGGGLELLGQAVGTEQSGLLPAGGQAAVDRNTQDSINNIKGRFAALGMSGSTEEATAISNAMQTGLVNQFGMAERLGAQQGQQGLGLAGLGFQGVAGGGSLGLGTAGVGTNIAQLGLGAYGQSGNLLSTLDSLGYNYSALSSNDWNAIASQGLSQMGLGISEQGVGAGLEGQGATSIAGGASIFSNLASDQMKEDLMLSSTIQSFFNAMGRGFGLKPGG